jgi:hypothetical protein
MAPPPPQAFLAEETSTPPNPPKQATWYRDQFIVTWSTYLNCVATLQILLTYNTTISYERHTSEAAVLQTGKASGAILRCFSNGAEMVLQP